MNVLLADALEHQATQGQFAPMADPISVEGDAAAELKTRKRFTVVIGNPPYHREQKALGDTGKRKGGVVRFETPGVEGSPLLGAVTETNLTSVRSACMSDESSSSWMTLMARLVTTHMRSSCMPRSWRM
ncbi:MAG: hypothetical protein OXI97_18240 [Acidimicrobiaceae bacterium]|nr:hypothetical protein [Acidimicrobiaceae bacterium]